MDKKDTKARLPLVAALLLSASVLAAQVSFLPDDSAVRDLRRMYAEAGRVLPTASYPLDRNDLHNFASALSGSTRNPAILRRLHSYDAALGFAEQAVCITARGDVCYEYTYRDREEWEDYYRLFVERAPIVSLDLSCRQDSWAVLHARAEVKSEHCGFVPDNLLRPCDGNPVAFENQILRQGYVHAYAGAFEIELGRNAVHYGAGRYSSLLPSQRLPFVDALRYGVRLGPIDMNTFVATLENREAVDDVDPAPLSFGSNVILCSLHRFEYHAARVRAGISGLCFVTRENNAFQLGDVLPVFSWHAADVGQNNLSVVVDLEVVPLAGLQLFAQYGLDDVDLRTCGIDDNGRYPTTDAAIAGLEYTPPALHGRLGFYLEGGYTHYLWGNYCAPLSRAILRVHMDGDNRMLPATSPFGPGALWAYAEGDWEPLQTLTVRTMAQVLSENSLANLVSTPCLGSRDVEDAPRIVTLSAGAEVCWRHGTLSIGAKPMVFCRDGVWWVEATLTCAAGLQTITVTRP
jgi:hypothetical protein